MNHFIHLSLQQVVFTHSRHPFQLDNGEWPDERTVECFIYFVTYAHCVYAYVAKALNFERGVDIITTVVCKEILSKKATLCAHPSPCLIEFEWTVICTV